MKLSEYGDFDVQTSLFSYRMATRVFSKTDRIPAEIVGKVKDLINGPDLIDKTFANAEPVWDVDADEYSTEEFTGVEIETYAFQDAGYIHAAVGKIVEDFLNTHTRTVTYVPKS
jgi:hypothetical protein